VHRIGRTGRACTTGTSVSFADEDDSFYIPAIEKFIGRKLDCIDPKEEWLTMPEPVFSKKKRGTRLRKKVFPAFQGEKPHPQRAKKGRPRSSS
jgi:superfamily II DNA/RNA helicase